jgi:hypothetical protein
MSFSFIFLLIALQLDINYSCAVPSGPKIFMSVGCNVKIIMEVETSVSSTFQFKFISVFFVGF